MNGVLKYLERDGVKPESLAGTQAEQLRKYLNDIGEHDRAYAVPTYFSNSFHCHVGVEQTPFEKQDNEFELFHMIEGGHIQYVRIDDPTNLEGMKAVVERGMEMGFYQGVNFDSMFCKDCGQHTVPKNGKIMTCGNCGSHDVAVISRVCGLT